MMNLLTRIGWEARVLDFRKGKTADQLRRAGDDPSDQPLSLNAAANEVVDYMLFVDEAPLSGPIHGATDFAKEFMAVGPRDHRGRSLRELDMRTRLLTYPCSYLIYSKQFDDLPLCAKTASYRRMWQVIRDSAARQLRTKTDPPDSLRNDRISCEAKSKRPLLARPFPPHAFMALELVADPLDDIRGTVRYPAAFGL